ncbi:restriction endonuclease subunit S [Gluconobacter sp.]|uniref:restriction endonuclease subunit S n=1 Tax=Gluconobacter sp. TaxID=1876758 RepID=UPI0039EBFE0A
MSFPKYPAYKDSGVEWIGEIPVGWSIKPFWTLFRRVKRNDHAEKELLSVYRDYGVIPKSSRDDNFNKPSDDLAAYQLVKKNDLVINKMKAWQGSCAVSNFEGIVSPAYFVFSSISNNFGKFIHYLLRCDLYISYYYSISKGVRPNQWDLDPETHSRMPVILPPLPEQQAIASFLDRECGKIDALIAEQERLIALLAEKRQAVISHAVTKGLNPNASMKDSGIPWIGMVPEGWEVKKVSHDFTAEKGKNGQLLTKEYCSEISGDFPVYSGQTENNGVMASINSYEFDFDNGVIFSTTVGAKAMSLKFLCGKFSLSQNCMIIFPKNNIIPEYSYYAFMPLFDYERSLIPDHMQPSFRISDLYNFSYVMPPFDEQIMILNFIKKKEMKLTSTEREVQRQITLLKERRAALISAAVTGKIDVRAQSKAIAA